MSLKKDLKKIPYLSRISSLAKKEKTAVWLVGGFLRDVYLAKRKPLIDFDFCVRGDSFKFAKKIKKLIPSKLIILDDKQKSYRIIIKKKNRVYTYDFSALRGDDLETDLSLRDFTINTLALDLTCLERPRLIDLLGARADIDKKCIKAMSERVIKDDPLRILRAFSFSVNYGFKIEKTTESLLKAHKNLLKQVSAERINEEIFKIFGSSDSYKAIKRMSDLKIIDVILPHITEQRGVRQGSYHHLDVWNHSLETLYRFELLLKRKFLKDKAMGDYLRRPVTGKHSLISVIKLACILHDAGKPLAKKKKNKRTIFHSHEKIGSQLIEDVYTAIKLSLKEKELLKRLVFWHLRPGYLADQNYPSRRAAYRFFRDIGPDAVAVVALSLADWRATRGPMVSMKKRLRHEKIMFNLIEHYFKEEKKQPLPNLVDGFDIMRKFKLKPSSLVGKVLAKIKEGQALGRISTKSDAFKTAAKLITRDKLTTKKVI